MCRVFVVCVCCCPCGLCVCVMCMCGVHVVCGVCVHTHVCVLAERATLSECLPTWMSPSGKPPPALSHSAVASPEEASWSCHPLAPSVILSSTRCERHAQAARTGEHCMHVQRSGEVQGDTGWSWPRFKRGLGLEEDALLGDTYRRTETHGRE